MMNKQNSDEVNKEVVVMENHNPSPTVEEATMPLPPSTPPVPHFEMMPPYDFESEPKTLLHGELNEAREAALEVLNTHTTEEAMQIFLTGLQPVGKTTPIPSENAAAYQPFGYDPFDGFDTDGFVDTDDEEDLTLVEEEDEDVAEEECDEELEG